MKLFLFIGFLVFTILIQGVHAQSLLRPSDSRIVSQGSLIYKQYCASCHGKTMRANGIGDLVFRTEHYRLHLMTRQVIHGIILIKYSLI